MDRREIIEEIGRIVDDVKAALLATADKQGKPSVRWVTPALIRGREGAIYSVTSARSEKTAHLRENPRVKWMFQTRALDKVISVDGRVNIVDNPSLKTEILEAIGNRLLAFWKSDVRERDLIVLETIMERAALYIPMKGTRETVDF